MADARQTKVVAAAKAKIGSKDWAWYAFKDNFIPTEPKCNLFVAQCLGEGGFEVPYTNTEGTKATILHAPWNFIAGFWGEQNKISTKRPLTARQWYNGECPGTTLVGEGKVGLEKSWPGDIVTDGSHVGIISGPQKTISASAKENKVVENTWGWRPDEIPKMRVYRYHP